MLTLRYSRYCTTLPSWSKYFSTFSCYKTNNSLQPIALAACLQIGLCTPNHMIQEMSMGATISLSIHLYMLTILGMHYNTEAGDHDLHSYVLNPEIFKVKDGYLDTFTGPGLGIEVDEEAVRRVAANTEPWPLQGFVGVDGGLREW
jgi:galactonate dehydratase